MLMKLGIVSAIGYGIYRYAMSNPKLASAFSSGGETGGGTVRPYDRANSYSPSDNLTSASGMASAGHPARPGMPPAVG